MEPGLYLEIDSDAADREDLVAWRVARWSSVISVLKVFGFLFLFSLVIAVAEAAEPLRPFCRSDDKQASPWLAANLEIRLPLPGDVTTVGELIEQLRDKNAIPVSWIEAQPHEPLRLEASLSHLDDLLRSVAEQHPDYQCEVRSGRLILRSADEIFDRTISGVDVVDQSQIAALDRYIEHLRATGSGFESWTRPLRVFIGDSPIAEEKVTLASKAPLLDHLVQLLGRMPNTYFTIPAPGEVPRTILISETK